MHGDWNDSNNHKTTGRNSTLKIKQNSGNCGIEWNSDVELQHWTRSAEVGSIHEVAVNENTWIQKYTEGSKQEHGVGSGAMIFKRSEMIAKLQFKLDNKSSNNQAEKLTILKALEKLEWMKRRALTHCRQQYPLTAELSWTRSKATTTTVTWWKRIE